MCLRSVFLLITRVAAWLRLSRREEAWRTAEILIHQLAVRQRKQLHRPKMNWADRVPLENRIRLGDLQVFRASGGVRVLVDQAVGDRFPADLLCADVGHGGVGSDTFVVWGARWAMPWCGGAVL
jgi:hypothetical protein